MGIENLAKGVFSQTVTPALKKVAGQIGGIIGADTGRDAKNRTNRPPPVEETKNLCFPKDLLTDNFAEGNHGHYIQFFINHQEKAKLTFGEDGFNKPSLSDAQDQYNLETEKKVAVSSDSSGLRKQFNPTLSSLSGEASKLELVLEKIKNERMNDLAANNPLSDGTFASGIQDIIADRGLESELENLKSSLMTDGGVTDFNELKTKLSQVAKNGAILAQMENFKRKLGVLAEDIQDPSVIDYLENNVKPQFESIVDSPASDQLIDFGKDIPRTTPSLSHYTGGANANVVTSVVNGGVGSQQGVFGKAVSGGETGNATDSKTGTTIDVFGLESYDRSIRAERAATKRLEGSICLFMPANVSVTQTAQYTDTEIGFGAMEAANVVDTFQQQIEKEGGKIGAAFDTVVETFPGIADTMGQALINLGVRTFSALPMFRGALEIQQMKAGEITANRMELAFKGMGKRAFQYTFKMLPKSSQEADEIRKIVYAFKHAMTPELKGARRAGFRTFIPPDTFNIQYMYRGAENKYLHHIGECILETMSVQYGGDRYKTHTESSSELDIDGQPITGAPPVETTITLNFKELGIVDRQKVQLGF